MKHSKPDLDTKSLTLKEAEQAVSTADRAHLAAVTDVMDVVRRYPAGMRSRGLIAELQPRLTFERSPETLSAYTEDQRAQLQIRIDYWNAVDAETAAKYALDAAKCSRDELRRAAEIAALGDGRAALARSIKARSDVEQLHREHVQALDRATNAFEDAYAAIAEAERALEKVREEAPARLAAEYRGAAVKPGPTVEQAETALTEVRRKKAAIGAARDELETEVARAAQAVKWSRDEVKTAAAHVVKVSPTLQVLLTAHAESEFRTLALRAALDALGREGALPADFVPKGYPQRPSPEPDRSHAFAWTVALEKLRSDPASALPEIG